MVEPSNLDRRKFIVKLTGTVGGVATLAATASLVQASPEVDMEQQSVSNPKTKGYQRTAHVEKYYQLADF